jgi:hypothetical protein
LLVWSTGVGASLFVKLLPFPKSPGGRYNWLVWPYNLYRLLLNFLQYTDKEVSYQMHEINCLGIPNMLRHRQLMSKSRILNRWCIPCRIGVDEWLRVPSVPDVFAVGDCSGFLESTGKEVLPALAQVISRTILTQFTNMRAFCQASILKKWGICTVSWSAIELGGIETYCKIKLNGWAYILSNYRHLAAT